MPEIISQVRNFNLKVIFLIHFIFVSIIFMGNWSGYSFIFYNTIFLIILLWAIYVEQNVEFLQMAMLINGIAIILDILLLIFDFPYHGGVGQRISAALVIIHIFVRPVTIFFLMKILEERIGATGSIAGLFSSPNRSSYEDIERNAVPTSQSAPNMGGYDFATAQQI